MKLVTLFAVILLCASLAHAQQQPPREWVAEWPETDFQKAAVAFSEIRSGGPPKDGIRSIDEPAFARLENGTASGWASELSPNEAVIALDVEVDARAYPLRILIWHEIVNDIVGGVPVAVTYCPLCNSALTFRRSLGGRVLDFGTTGKLRNSDLVMYDRQTESWWQQFTGEAIVGELTGAELELVPSRLVSFGQFATEFPNGRVLVPADPQAREYGRNPYLRYDAAGQTPFLYSGDLPDGIDPMERVVAIETSPGIFEAWALSLIREQREIRRDDLVLRWQPGQSSALDRETVAAGRDVGTVSVSRVVNGETEPVAFDTPFAFAFHAFRPDGPIHVGDQQDR
ncbi:MAG: DUF3179 domain-containing protein [Pseudomonadota bacterium]|nr:DUF3179 domain-containing protein [Pseudomonadota bacterium]